MASRNRKPKKPKPEVVVRGRRRKELDYAAIGRLLVRLELADIIEREKVAADAADEDVA